jgi:hypothetical protein
LVSVTGAVTAVCVVVSTGTSGVGSTAVVLSSLLQAVSRRKVARRYAGESGEFCVIDMAFKLRL